MQTWGVYVDGVTGEVSVIETGETERSLPGCERVACVPGETRMVALMEAANKVGAVWVNRWKPYVPRDNFRIPQHMLTGPPTFHLRAPVPGDFSSAWIEIPSGTAPARSLQVVGGRDRK